MWPFNGHQALKGEERRSVLVKHFKRIRIFSSYQIPKQIDLVYLVVEVGTGISEVLEMSKNAAYVKHKC